MIRVSFSENINRSSNVGVTKMNNPIKVSQMTPGDYVY